MAWSAIFLDGGAVIALPKEFAEVEKLFANSDRVAIAKIALKAIDDGTWPILARTYSLTDGPQLDHFFKDWDTEAILPGFANMLRKIIALDMPIKIRGMVNIDEYVMSHVREDHIEVMMFGPEKALDSPVRNEI